MRTGLMLVTRTHLALLAALLAGGYWAPYAGAQDRPVFEVQLNAITLVLRANDSFAFEVKALDALGREVKDVAPRWTLSAEPGNTGVGELRVDGTTGMFVAKKPGRCRLRVNVAKRSDECRIEVRPARNPRGKPLNYKARLPARVRVNGPFYQFGVPRKGKGFTATVYDKYFRVLDWPRNMLHWSVSLSRMDSIGPVSGVLTAHDKSREEVIYVVVLKEPNRGKGGERYCMNSCHVYFEETKAPKIAFKNAAFREKMWEDNKQRMIKRYRDEARRRKDAQQVLVSPIHVQVRAGARVQFGARAFGKSGDECWADLRAECTGKSNRLDKETGRFAAGKRMGLYVFRYTDAISGIYGEGTVLVSPPGTRRTDGSRIQLVPAAKNVVDPGGRTEIVATVYDQDGAKVDKTLLQWAVAAGSEDRARLKAAKSGCVFTARRNAEPGLVTVLCADHNSGVRASIEIRIRNPNSGIHR